MEAEEREFLQTAVSTINDHVFVSDDSDFIWRNDSHWREAWARFWYRKFYTETRTGQLMVLRPDEPTLYQFPRSQVRDIGRRCGS